MAVVLLCVQHNILNYFAKLDRPKDARATLPKVRKLSQELGNDLDLIRLTWTEGLLAVAAREGEAAAELLLAAQAELVARRARATMPPLSPSTSPRSTSRRDALPRLRRSPGR